jgi:exodeoxyribonuclease V alpha subunit
MKRPTAPNLLPTGTARQAVAALPAYPQGLVELLHASDLGESSAYLAWQVAQLGSGLSPSERDAFMLLVGRLLVAQAVGSTRLATTKDDRALLARLPDLVQVPPSCTPLVLDGSHLYTQRAYACETRVASWLARGHARRTAFAPAAIARALDEVAAQGSPRPSDEQMAAVATVLERHLGVISGGPGTGKTTTALALVRSLVRLGVAPATIGLCAPTGKAAGRLEDDFRARLAALKDPVEADRALLAECPPAQTLHRLLGASRGPGGVLRVAGDPLPFAAVIVDESSMIDLVLMDKLLAALPDDVLLILLGDADQLPSIAAGAVFRDLGQFAVRLERGYRTSVAQPEGKQIVDLAAAVRAGHAEAAINLCALRAGPSALCRRGVEHLAPDQRDDLLRDHYQRIYQYDSQHDFGDARTIALIDHVFAEVDGSFTEEDAHRLDDLAAHLAQTRILAVTRARRTGVERCNAFLHDLYGGGSSFLPGEPVLMLRNDYERDLWNGDQGIAVRVRRPGHPVVVAFRSRKGWLAVDPQAVPGALDFGFALTVHKAQGSEFDEVLLILPDFACPLVTRELLYTAVSRARKSVVLCGALDQFKAGIGTAENRGSGLAERL